MSRVFGSGIGEHGIGIFCANSTRAGDVQRRATPRTGLCLGGHGYNESYCYLTLCIFAGEQLLYTRLRAANQDAAAVSLDEVERIVAQLRAQWPEVKIILRADSGFCHEQLMNWCECNRVECLFGLARNQRLCRIIGREMHEAKQLHQATGKAARIFAEFPYQTRNSWSRPRRVVAKAEYLDKGENPVYRHLTEIK